MCGKRIGAETCSLGPEVGEGHTHLKEESEASSLHLLFPDQALMEPMPSFKRASFGVSVRNNVKTLSEVSGGLLTKVAIATLSVHLTTGMEQS